MGGRGMPISRQVRPRFKTRNDEIVAGLRKVAGASAPMDPKIVIKRKVAEVATLMALVHGGEYRPVVDHQNRIVLIRPD